MLLTQRHWRSRRVRLLTGVMMAGPQPGRSRARPGGLIALGYVAFAITTLLLEYRSESDKLSRGMYTDTFSPFIFSDLVSWPTSAFVSHWTGYPDRFSQESWQKALNDAVPGYLWAAVIQALLIFVLIEVAGIMLRARRSSIAERRRLSR